MGSMARIGQAANYVFTQGLATQHHKSSILAIYEVTGNNGALSFTSLVLTFTHSLILDALWIPDQPITSGKSKYARHDQTNWPNNTSDDNASRETSHVSIVPLGVW